MTQEVRHLGPGARLGRDLDPRCHEYSSYPCHPTFAFEDPTNGQAKSVKRQEAEKLTSDVTPEQRTLA